MNDQTRDFAAHEALRYLRARQDQGSPTMWPDDFADIPRVDVASVLDAGCGIGLNLEFAVSLFDVAHAVGTEPSTEAVELLTTRYGVDSPLA